MSDDDEFRRLMARVDLSTTPLDAPLSPRAEAELLRIKSAPTRPAQRAVRPRWFALSGIAAMVLVLVFAVQHFTPLGGTGNNAVAATPPLLVGSVTDTTFGETMDRAMEKLNGVSATPSPVRGATYQAWFMNTDVNASGEAISYVSPQEVTFEWAEDLSGRLLTVAGKPLPSADGRRASSDAPAEGTVLSDQSFAPGETGVLFSQEPPADADALRAYLQSAGGYVDDSDPVIILDTVMQLLNEWTLTNSEKSALLQILKGVDGFQSLGDVIDRLGRPGHAFTAQTPDGHWQNVLVIGSETGDILSMEKVYLGGIPESFLTAPSVVSYVAWSTSD